MMLRDDVRHGRREHAECFEDMDYCHYDEHPAIAAIWRLQPLPIAADQGTGSWAVAGAALLGRSRRPCRDAGSLWRSRRHVRFGDQ